MDDDENSTELLYEEVEDSEDIPNRDGSTENIEGNETSNQEAGESEKIIKEKCVDGHNEDNKDIKNEDNKDIKNEDNKDIKNEDNKDIKNEDNEDIKKIKEDHFSKNKPDEFSSENFKVEIGGLPKYYALGQLKKLLNTTLQLDSHKVKPGGLGRFAYVNFKDEDSRFKAMTILNGYKWHGGTLTVQKADPAKDPMLLAKIDFLKVPKKEYEMLPLLERIQKAVTPYHGMSYEDQLKEKERAVRSVLRKFGTELAIMNPELKKFVHWHKIRRKGQICELDDMVESPIKEGYRNKCEFTIGKNKESEKPVVGFRVASYKDGSVEVGPVSHLRHLNDQMKLVVSLMETYLDSSKYEPFNPFSHKGVWRQLTVRTSNNSDVMLVVVIHPQEMAEDEIDEIKEDVKKYFTEGDGQPAGVTSIFFQKYGQKESGKDVEFEHIYGKTYIEETILGKTFKASPDAFLQVNTPACEVLYNKIAEVAGVDPTSILLDICCGVGTIGLSIAEGAYKTYGVELTSKAVEDARANAESNGIANAVFFNGKAEDYIDSMIEKAQRTNTIAIVDPPRAGLSGTVMNALRKCEYLNKLVYVSCDPQAALRNFEAVCRPRSKTYKGSFFVPIRATPVDLFPDTPHFELVIVFERYDECKWDRIMDGNPRPKDKEYFDRVPELKVDEDHYSKEREEKKRKERPGRRSDDEGRSWGRGGRDSWKGGREDRERGEGGGGRNWGREDRDNDGGGGGRRDNDGGGGDGRRDNYGGGGGGRRDNYGGGGGGRRGGRDNRGWGGGGGGRRDFDDSWSSSRSYEDDGGGRGRRKDDWGRGEGRGGRRPWGDGGSRPPPLMKTPRNFRSDFEDDSEPSSGFQEGFQAGLEAMSTQYPGFGQGGGWNMAQTQEECGPPLDGDGGYSNSMNNSSSNVTPKGNPYQQQQQQQQQETAATAVDNSNSSSSWGGYDASGNYSAVDPSGTTTPTAGYSTDHQLQQGYNSSTPVTYPTSVTNPPAVQPQQQQQQQQQQQGYGYQGWNQGGSSWVTGNQAVTSGNPAAAPPLPGGSWNQYQQHSYEPPNKKWRGGAAGSAAPPPPPPADATAGNQNAIGYDYSNY